MLQTSNEALEIVRYDRTRKFIILFTVVGCTFSLAFGTINILVHQKVILGAIELVAALITGLNLVYLQKTHNERISSNIMMMSMYLVLMSLLSFGGIDQTGLLWFATYPALGYAMKKSSEANYWMYALGAGQVMHSILGTMGIIPMAFSINQLIQLNASLAAVGLIIAIRKHYTEKDEEKLAQELSEIKILNTILEKEQEHESRLQNELLRYKIAFDQAYDFMVITDKEGTIIYANAAAERVTGYARAEMIGKKAGALWGGIMPKEFYQKLWHTIKAEKKEFIGDCINRRKTGEEYTAKITITPVVDLQSTVQYFVGTERDITKEKALETAKTEFLSFAAHQLRTPITSIKWYIEMLKDGTAGELNHQQKSIADKIEMTNQRMLELMYEFLNITRMESGRITITPHNVRLKDFCAQLQTEVQSLLHEKSQVLKILCDSEDRELFVDEPIFRQIILNYLTNAIKYSPQGSMITIEGKQSDKGFLISVTDKGIGIPTSQHSLIFSKFFRAENARLTKAEGTGLGLYFIKRIIDLVGGEIGFTSKLGEGSSFYVIIPEKGWKSHEGVISFDENKNE